ncbi:hypothetical protein SAMN02799631_06517 [Methylobacterium sp. 174MFSha1.1]|uniref:hypothetical protein n=1 Tax=Methylobacterium sp. 174MFSha1.1 TaxID=1502749 RepID=UPI0008EDFA78|nr:hypothetical protein [Methylobacterium sp. 174MFSha1.1]SFV16773.1 hypothetical protein SAMN02799631_06517 [Methylobacterium sp. 174MFSha1.1]
MHAPVLDYLLSALRAHCASGRVHVDVAHGLDGYMQHVIRLADARILSGPEALVAANRALSLALSLPEIPEDRHAPRS